MFFGLSYNWQLPGVSKFMEITWFNSTQNIISFIIQGALILVLFGCTLFTIFKTVKRKNVSLMILFIFLLAIFAFVCELNYLFVVAIFLALTINIFAFISNIGDFRKFFANPFSRTNAKKVSTVKKIVDKKDIFEEIQNAAVELSDKKIGALITFEKDTSLADMYKNGVVINAPISKELISTIFYPGTRLHDGAVIVKDGIIMAASVFYTPTTKPFATKYGSRHRAALGISEISDAVTVVISEETGFVSIAHDGEIHQVEANYLAQTLANYF